MTSLAIRVNGIPCRADILHYNPATSDTLEQPGDPEAIEFELLDRRGRRATWLDKYLTPDIEMEVLAAYIEHRAGDFEEPEYD